MPVNKNYDLRKKILDRLIMKKRYGKEELLDELNDQLSADSYPIISMRQLGYDIDAMKTEALKLDGEIIYSRGDKCYYYEPEDFSLTGIPINKDDIQLLTQALAILRQINGLKNSRELESIIERLGEKLGISTEDLGEILVFDNVPGLKGIEHLNGLLKMVIDKQPILLQYQRYADPEPQLLTVHPYFLKEYRGRWYVFGWNDEARKIHNYPLDRIIAFDEAYVEFDDKHRVSCQSWLKDVVGVTRNDGKAQTIEFKLKKPRGYYVETKPIHPSQKKVNENENEMTFKIKVIPNKELDSVLASFGEDLIMK